MVTTTAIVFVLFMLFVVVLAVGLAWLGYKQDQQRQATEPETEEE